MPALIGGFGIWITSKYYKFKKYSTSCAEKINPYFISGFSDAEDRSSCEVHNEYLDE